MSVSHLTPAPVGEKHGRLTVIKKWRQSGKTRCLCQCDCGRQKEALLYNLRSGNTLSCGCLQNESRYVHGHAKEGKPSKAYRTWLHIHDRCRNQRNSKWLAYGGRGIRVCERWKVFENFLNDMGDPLGAGEITIDRIDNNGNYEPGNCRWVSRKVQQRNMRSNRLLTLGDKTQPLAAWAEQIGMKQNSLLSRLRKGWTVERALTEPLGANVGKRRKG